MVETDRSYQTDTGTEQGADIIFVRRTGITKFWDVNYTGLFMRNFIESRRMGGAVFDSVVLSSLNSRLTSVGAIVGGLSNSIPAGAWIFELATGNSLFSMSMPLINDNSGVRLLLRGDGVIGDGNVLLRASIAGGSVSGIEGVDLSSLNLSAGFFVELISPDGETWSIIDRNGSCTERASS
jgi:hypothetical protein